MLVEVSYEIKFTTPSMGQDFRNDVLIFKLPYQNALVQLDSPILQNRLSAEQHDRLNLLFCR